MITLLLVPLMVNGINKHNDAATEWRWIFIITACVLIVTNLAFVLLGSGDSPYWTSDEFLKEQIVKHLKNSEIGVQTVDVVLENGAHIVANGLVDGDVYGYIWKTDKWMRNPNPLVKKWSDRKNSAFF